MATPSTEPKDTQILDRVETLLAALESGAAYWYTPTVIRADHYDDKRLYRTDKSPVYIIRDTSPPLESPENRQFGKDARILTVYILTVYYDSRADKNPYTRSAPSRGDIRRRMVRDVTKALNADPSLNGLAIDIDVTEPELDFEEGLESWIIAEVPLRVMFEHAYDSP